LTRVKRILRETWSSSMRGKHGGSPIGWLLTVVVVSACLLPPARAIDRSDARVLELQRGLRVVSPRVQAAPSASSFDLENLQRRLHDLRIDAPRDPRVQELATELRRLHAHADRNADRPSAAVRPRTSPLAAHAPIQKPRYLGGAHTAALTPARPYFGQRLVTLQRTVAAIERRLEVSDTMTAARLLERAQVDLATLRRVFDDAVAGNPNLIALDERIRALEERMAPRRP
jgi:hypothetical protein